MPVVFHTQQLTSPGSWETVTIDDTPEDAFGSLVSYMEASSDPWALRTVMAEQEGTEIGRAVVVELIRGSDSDGPYFWAKCAVSRCICNVHYDSDHVDYTGYGWTEDVPLVEIPTPHRVVGSTTSPEQLNPSVTVKPWLRKAHNIS